MASLRTSDLLVELLASSSSVPVGAEPVPVDTAIATGALVIEVMQGVRGPEGPPGVSTAVTLNQATPSSSWQFNHNLGVQYPAIEVFIGGVRVYPSVDYSLDVATITFPSVQTGVAIARR